MAGFSGLKWLHRQRNMLGSAAHALLSMPGSKCSPWKHSGHTSSRAGPPWLPVSGIWEGPGGECSSSYRSFHQVFPGVCHQDPDHPNDCQNPMGQVHCPLWVTQKDPHGSRMKFWESVSGWPLWPDGNVESADQPIPSANQWPVWKIQFHPDQYAWALSKEKKSEWKNHIGILVHVYNCTQNSATGFSPYFLMFGRQLHLLINVTLGLALHTITEPNTSKFAQKIRECTWWAQKKAEAFQAKEVWWHKCNYDKQGTAVALAVGDTVLVCVTAFKCHHKMQDQWENREYVVEKQPYPNVPVSVVCPRDGEGYSQTLHRNYLLPISSNLEQGEMDKPVVGVGNDTSPTPVPPVSHAPVEAEPSGMVTSSSTGSTPENSPDQPVPLRHGTRTTRNQLPWRYWDMVQ